MPRFILSHAYPLNPERNKSRTIDVRPDDTDARDYIFQPSLTLLPEIFDENRGYPNKVFDQGSEGACVGFALAAVINISLRKRYKKFPENHLVSARMLYEMAQCYDEWKGENYAGTSLRGAMKGWHRHGVTTEELWSTKAGVDMGSVLKDALRCPLGAYYRIIDNDVHQVQAAVVEGDAVLASAWVHSGWENNKLLPANEASSGLKMIRKKIGKTGLHSFAIVGYTPYGFIIQNSWGEEWGSGGYALLGYDDWIENRQDAWVARPGPETRDSEGNAKIFRTRFPGDADTMSIRTGTTIHGLDLDPQLAPFLINTGDKGALSTEGRIRTPQGDLHEMARQILTTPVTEAGYRHVVLYANGGFTSEKKGAETANRLFRICRQKGVCVYFFIWESGIVESLFGWLKSTDDALGPVGFSWKEAWDRIREKAGDIWHKIQYEIGEKLAPPLRTIFWKEGKGRAIGASQPGGGARLFVEKLFEVISQVPDDNYRFHLVGHSGGSIYLAHLYENKLSSLLQQHAAKAKLASIQFMAPAISINDAQTMLKDAIDKNNFLVYMLKKEDEEKDSIGIYPHSLLMYAREYADENEKPLHLLGIRKDFVDKKVDFATPVPEEKIISEKHQEFEDEGHEIEDIIEKISNDEYI